MKTVFNFNRLSPVVAAVLVAAALLAVPSAARAQSTYWSTRELLADFFKSSEKVGFRKVEIATADKTRIERRLGAPLLRTSYTVFVAESRGRVDGYAIFDEEQGQHLPISFAVKISPEGTVERQEITAYREARGDEVRDARFRAQFVGKTARDALRTGDDVVAVSGATISSRAMSLGVKRALVIMEELVLRPQRASSPTTTAAR